MIQLLGVIVAFLIVAYQDIRYRQVQWILLLIIALLNTWWAATSVPLDDLIAYTLSNLTFVAFNLALIVLYIRLKFKASVRLMFDQYMGLGDVLFWIAITPLFSFYIFVLFFLLSLTLSLISFMILTATPLRTSFKTVPLAGFQAVFYGALVTAYLSGLDFDFYDDLAILQFTTLGTD